MKMISILFFLVMQANPSLAIGEPLDFESATVTSLVLSWDRPVDTVAIDGQTYTLKDPTLGNVRCVSNVMEVSIEVTSIMDLYRSIYNRFCTQYNNTYIKNGDLTLKSKRHNQSFYLFRYWGENEIPDPSCPTLTPPTSIKKITYTVDGEGNETEERTIETFACEL